MTSTMLFKNATMLFVDDKGGEIYELICLLIYGLICLLSLMMIWVLSLIAITDAMIRLYLHHQKI